ncbi:hypothetical protein BDV93DRAFT_512626 [Ceratobasidium sp. AG-I]|nr:hypothetical protein BDV93DRAFT_512626 [Ceratobasidium sp. AG-I]
MPCSMLAESRLEYQNLCVAIGTAGEGHDQLLTAYNQTEGNRRADCWIPAVPGSPFCIHLGYNGNPAAKRGLGLKAKIYLDNLLVEIIFMPIKARKICNEIEVTGVELDGLMELPFRFDRREVTVRVLGPRQEPSVDQWLLARNHKLLQLPIPEGKRKLRHELAATLGAPVPYKGISSDVETENLGPKVSFIFHYAPKGWLEFRFGNNSFSGAGHGDIKPMPPPGPPQCQLAPSTLQKRRVDWFKDGIIDVDALDEDEKPHGSIKVKRVRTKGPQVLTGAVPPGETIDQWRLGC